MERSRPMRVDFCIRFRSRPHWRDKGLQVSVSNPGRISQCRPDATNLVPQRQTDAYARAVRSHCIRRPSRRRPDILKNPLRVCRPYSWSMVKQQIRLSRRPRQPRLCSIFQTQKTHSRPIRIDPSARLSCATHRPWRSGLGCDFQAGRCNSRILYFMGPHSENMGSAYSHMRTDTHDSACTTLYCCDAACESRCGRN